MKKTKVGRLFYLAMHTKDLEKLWGFTRSETIARVLEHNGYIELVEENGQLYYIEEKGVSITRRDFREIILSLARKYYGLSVRELTKEFEDKKLAKDFKFFCDVLGKEAA